MLGTVVNREIWPLDYKKVVLTDCKAKKQFDQCLEYFMHLPNDDILYGFRKRAGLETPGKELGGWYSNDGSFNIYEWDEIFNTFGQWLSFFAKAFVVTGRGDIKTKLEDLISGWGNTIEKDGYFFYSWNNNAYHYSYEKVMTGLVDSYVYAGIENAYKYLEIVTEWAKKNLEMYKNRANDKRATFTGGEVSIRCVDNEWYTLSENLYRAYLATDNKKYLDFADKWLYEQYWEAMRTGNAEYLKGVHGYSHVNTLCSAAMAYYVSGEKKYLETIVNAYKIFMKYQVLASGGFGFDEHLADANGSNYAAVESVAKSFEVACSSYAVLKLTRYLLMFTKDAKYADWAERVLYNGLYAALPMHDDEKRRGKTFYYADYRIGGGRKVYYEHSFPCCSGTYPLALTEYFNMIYFEDMTGIYIVHYIPSIFKENSGEESVEIITDYPQRENIKIKLHGYKKPNVILRIPSWIKDKTLHVVINGKARELEVIPGDWLRLEGDWKGDSIIEINFPMYLYTRPIAKEYPQRAALMYGPVMLAAKGRHRYISTSAQYPDSFIQKGKDAMTFYTKDNALEFIPFWKYGEKEWYTVYLDYNVS